jgi:DNA-binding IclR family transcriptional regulator
MARLKHAPGLQRNRSLQRAASLFRAMSAHPEGAPTAALARETGLPYATAARMLVTLSDAALADRLDDGDRWILGHELIRLARRVDPYGGVIRMVRPALERIAGTTGESAMLGIWVTPLEVDVVDQVDSPRLVGATRWVGRPFELNASAMGKLALAALEPKAFDQYVARTELRKCTPHTIVDPSSLAVELQRVRKLGYATTLDELEEGVAGIAVPIYADGGALAASLALSAPSFRMTTQVQRQALRVLRREASAIKPINAFDQHRSANPSR